MNKFLFKVGFAVSLITLIFVAYSAYVNFNDFERDNDWVAHSERIEKEINVLSRVPQAISNEIRRGFLLNDTLNFVEMQNHFNSVDRSSKLLDSLVSDNYEQSANVETLIVLIHSYLQKANRISVEHRVLSKKEIQEYIKEEYTILNLINQAGNHVLSVEKDILDNRLEERKKSRFMAQFVLLTLTVISLGLISYLFISIFYLLRGNEKDAVYLIQKVGQLNQEIDERRRLELLLTNVLNSSNNGIMALTSVRNSQNEIVDFEYTIVNDAACDMTTVSRKDFLGKSMLEVLPGNKTSGLMDAYKHVVETGQIFNTIHNFSYDKIDAWFVINAIKNGDGFVVTFTDVSSQKQKEQELIKTSEELKSTNHQLEQFAYIASHDLQEPLRKVRTFGDRLISIYSDQLDKRGLDYIERMQNAAERMQVLIDDILKFSRLSRSDREFSKVDLNLIFNEALETLDLKIKEKKGSVIGKDLPVVKGDSTELMQLFLNLIGNSLKYSREDTPPEIEIIAHSGQDSKIEKTIGKYWKITCKDNGIGFDPKHKEQIFVIFKRLHGRTEYEGTGIGLAICEKIVSNHGGIITADSKPGSGSIFTIYLPKNLHNKINTNNSFLSVENKLQTVYEPGKFTT